MKKSYQRFIFAIFIGMMILQLAGAELKIEKAPVQDSIISELGKPAVYDFRITNLGQDDTFRIYSLVGVDILPNENFSMKAGEVINKRLEFYPAKEYLKNSGTFPFLYKIESQKASIQSDSLALSIYKLKDAIEIGVYNIELNSEKAIVYAKNKANYNFGDIQANFRSSFFNFDKKFSLDAHDKKEFEIALNSQEIKKFVAGKYNFNAELEIEGIKENYENDFYYTEKPEITTTEDKNNYIIYLKQQINKKNDGNLPVLAQISIKKNIISRLFTTFSIEPNAVERKGFFTHYTFQKEIKPSEVFSVKIVTSWFYPLLFLIALAVIGLLINALIATDVILRKRVSFVKTKGGEFALKTSIIVRARKFAENIKVVDKLPPMASLYRTGYENMNIDEKNRRLSWNIDSLQAGEERVLSYVIYSKVGFVGKLELPRALAIYEEEGKIKEVESNKAFFVTEPRKREDY